MSCLHTYSNPPPQVRLPVSWLARALVIKWPGVGFLADFVQESLPQPSGRRAKDDPVAAVLRRKLAVDELKRYTPRTSSDVAPSGRDRNAKRRRSSWPARRVSQQALGNTMVPSPPYLPMRSGRSFGSRLGLSNLPAPAAVVGIVLGTLVLAAAMKLFL